jgi:outer membrane protein assembly factor BamB
MEDGQLLWERLFSLYRGRSRSPDLHGDILYIRQQGSGEDYLYTLDARTGEILSTESLWTADHFLVFARFPQLELQILTVQDPFILRAVDPVTRQTLWQVEQRPGLFLWYIQWPPVLLDDLLLLDLRGEVLALDAGSGQIRWRSFVSDHPETWFATGTRAFVVGDTIYAMRRDARLVRLDAKTGQETGYIQFAPPLSEKNPYGGSNVIGLAGNGQMLFVSFADSQELIALGP